MRVFQGRLSRKLKKGCKHDPNKVDLKDNGLKYFVKKMKKKVIPMILETPGLEGMN